jgi:hypothetical protein
MRQAEAVSERYEQTLISESLGGEVKRSDCGDLKSSEPEVLVPINEHTIERAAM